jgi:MFS family permease
MRRFSGRNVVNGSIRVWATTLPQLTLICAAFLAPTFALSWFLRTGVGKEEFQGILGLVSSIAFFLTQSAIVALVFQKLRQERPNVFASLRAGITRIFSVLGIALVVCLTIFAFFFVVSALTVAAPDLFVLALFPVLFVPFFVLLFVAWSVAVPAAVVERLSPGKALARSMRLTKGVRLRVFGTLVAVVFVVIVGGFVLGLVRGAIDEEFGVITLIAGVFWAAFGSLLSVWSVVAYHELRESKEGIGLDQLASVFQ